MNVLPLSCSRDATVLKSNNLVAAEVGVVVPMVGPYMLHACRNLSCASKLSTSFYAFIRDYFAVR